MAKAYGSPGAVLVLVFALAAVGVRAEPVDAAAPQAAPVDAAADAPRIDETAEELMRGACAYLQSKNAFSVHGEATFDEVFRTGRHVQHSRAITYLLKRPDRLRAEVIGDKGRRDFYYDGKAVTITDVDAKVYGTFAAPATIEAMLDDAANRFGVTMPLADLASAAPCAALETGVARGWYLGRHYFAGQQYHHLLLSSSEIDLQVWLPVSGPALFRKLLLTYKNDPGTPRYSLELSDWNFAPSVEEAAFVFAPPAGTRKIGFVEFAATAPAAGTEPPQ